MKTTISHVINYLNQTRIFVYLNHRQQAEFDCSVAIDDLSFELEKDNPDNDNISILSNEFHKYAKLTSNYAVYHWLGKYESNQYMMALREQFCDFTLFDKISFWILDKICWEYPLFWFYELWTIQKMANQLSPEILQELPHKSARLAQLLMDIEFAIIGLESKLITADLLMKWVLGENTIDDNQRKTLLEFFSSVVNHDNVYTRLFDDKGEMSR